MFSGMPSFQIWLEYPSNIASYFIRYWNAMFPNPVHTILLYLLGAYLLFCTLRMKPLLAAVGSALDHIIARFGTDAVAEVTGRSRRIVEDGGGRQHVESRSRRTNLDDAARSPCARKSKRLKSSH